MPLGKGLGRYLQATIKREGRALGGVEVVVIQAAHHLQCLTYYPDRGRLLVNVNAGNHVHIFVERGSSYIDH